jgi:hypothetical protein
LICYKKKKAYLYFSFIVFLPSKKKSMNIEKKWQGEREEEYFTKKRKQE